MVDDSDGIPYRKHIISPECVTSVLEAYRSVGIGMVRARVGQSGLGVRKNPLDRIVNYQQGERMQAW